MTLKSIRSSASHYDYGSMIAMVLLAGMPLTPALAQESVQKTPPPVYTPSEAEKNIAGLDAVAKSNNCGGDQSAAFHQGALEAQDGNHYIVPWTDSDLPFSQPNACQKFVEADTKAGAKSPSLNTTCCKFGFSKSLDIFVDKLSKLSMDDKLSPALLECVVDYQGANAFAKSSCSAKCPIANFPQTYAGCVLAGHWQVNCSPIKAPQTAAVCADPSAISTQSPQKTTPTGTGGQPKVQAGSATTGPSSP